MSHLMLTLLLTKVLFYGNLLTNESFNASIGIDKSAFLIYPSIRAIE